MSPEEAKTVQVYEGKGCRACNDTGFKGRVALYEIMPMSDELKDLVLQGVSAVELKGKPSHWVCEPPPFRLNKLKEGVTTTRSGSRLRCGLSQC